MHMFYGAPSQQQSHARSDDTKNIKDFSTTKIDDLTRLKLSKSDILEIIRWSIHFIETNGFISIKQSIPLTDFLRTYQQSKCWGPFECKLSRQSDHAYLSNYCCSEENLDYLYQIKRCHKLSIPDEIRISKIAAFARLSSEIKNIYVTTSGMMSNLDDDNCYRWGFKVCDIPFSNKLKSPEDCCLLGKLLFYTGQYDLTIKTLLIPFLLKHYPFSFAEIPVEYKEIFITALTSIRNAKTEAWTSYACFFERYLDWNCLKDLKTLKIQLLSLILSLQNQQLKQIALWQILDPLSILGSLFHIKRYLFFSPKINDPNSELYYAAKALNGLLRNSQQTQIDPESENELKNAVSLHPILIEEFPLIYDALFPLPHDEEEIELSVIAPYTKRK